MLREETARPRASRQGGRAAELSTRPAQHSTVFYTRDGRVVGHLKDGWLVKHVDSRKHQLRRPPAWAVDVEHLGQLRDVDALGVKLVDVSTGTEWSATLEAFDRYGLPLDRGHGRQLALPLSKWCVRSAGQLGLFEQAS